MEGSKVGQKVELIEKTLVKGSLHDTKYYCPYCGDELMWTYEFLDVASSTVNRVSECKHFEWYQLWCNPEYFDTEKWQCQMEEPLIRKIKDRVVFVFITPSEYYVLVRKRKK